MRDSWLNQVCWSSWYWWAECKACTSPSGRLLPQTRNVQNSCPMKMLQNVKQKRAGDRTAESCCREPGATELPGAPGQPCQLLKSGEALGKDPPQGVSCCSVWKLWHWLMPWWCLVLQLFGISPFIHEGWGSRSPPPGSWAALRLAGQSQGSVSLWEGGTADWNSPIVSGQRMYPFRTAMQLILFANKKRTLAVFHDSLWAYFYVKELII